MTMKLVSCDTLELHSISLKFQLDASHPVLGMIRDIEKSEIVVRRINLNLLDAPTVTEWIEDTLNASYQDIVSLSQQIFARTQGNPFYVKMFLRTLLDEKLLVSRLEMDIPTISYDANNEVDPTSRKFKLKWDWDPQEIARSHAMNNVVDFIVSRMNQLLGIVHAL